MHLTPHEIDKLMLHNVGFLAQKRLARGLRLNHPETVGLIAAVILEFIRDGKRVAELMDLGRALLGRRQVLAGVPELITEVQVEGTFADGSKLVTVHHPIAAMDGDLAMALHGSFLPVPTVSSFGAEPSDDAPGAVTVGTEPITLNAGRRSIGLTVTNTADRPIQVGSHYHFIETNPYLRFDRGRAYGYRLDIAAGTAVRFEPGESKAVQLVEISGARVISGGNALASGPVSAEGRDAAMARVIERGFAHLAQPVGE